MNPALLRLSSFVGILGLALALEWWRPRERLLDRRPRWIANLSLAALGAGAGKLIALLEWAARLEEGRVGLLHLVSWPAWLEAMVAVVALDLLIYFQHRAFHAFHPFWRLHRVHHADPGFDVTTGVRFHPVEIFLSIGIKLAGVAAIGATPAAVLVFEILLNASALLTHSNVRISPTLDRVLRWAFVTSEMHRIHHSTESREHRSNYGFFLSVWDRLFGSYLTEPSPRFRIGLPDVDASRANRLSWVILSPLRRSPS